MLNYDCVTSILNFLDKASLVAFGRASRSSSVSVRPYLIRYIEFNLISQDDDDDNDNDDLEALRESINCFCFYVLKHNLTMHIKSMCFRLYSWEPAPPDYYMPLIPVLDKAHQLSSFSVRGNADHFLSTPGVNSVLMKLPLSHLSLDAVKAETVYPTLSTLTSISSTSQLEIKFPKFGSGAVQAPS
jgi:hypothetical protein